MEQHQANNELIERSGPLQEDILKLTCGCIPSNWDLPVLEIKITYDDFHRFQSMHVRLYDLKGDEELPHPPEPLLVAAAAYHALFMSFSHAWDRCMLTITPDEQGRVVGLKWNYKYPPWRLSFSPL
jgi:hypothetical protein